MTTSNFGGTGGDAFKCTDPAKGRDNHFRSFPVPAALPAGLLACLLTLSSQWSSRNENQDGNPSAGGVTQKCRSSRCIAFRAS
ncbi:hypothetical protein [Mesorhizobium sp. 131-2-1]|uniref:hypothetical protein n=1 Tax=Mesorhizobium sp. 131-2-1 TaxID=2744518 RepID=UPI0019253CF5|nr:hypothetical protein [Mesorhizobium sp. 131-2-1]